MIYWNIFLIFSRKQDFTFHANCLFSGKTKKNITNFLSADLAKREVKVKSIWRMPWTLSISFCNRETGNKFKHTQKNLHGTIISQTGLLSDWLHSILAAVWQKEKNLQKDQLRRFLRPSQPIRVMSSQSVYLIIVFLGWLSPLTS